MLNVLKWLLPAAVAVALFVTVPVKAADAAASATITGKVVDKDGAAVPDVKVNLAKPSTGRGQRSEALATATTDKDGKYELKIDKAKVADGDYNVRTFVRGKGSASKKITVKGGKATPAMVDLKLAQRTRGARGGNQQ